MAGDDRRPVALARMLRSGAAIATARIFSLILAAVQLPLLTNVLSPAQYGVVAVAIVVATYFGLVTAEPTTLAFQRFPGIGSRANYRFSLMRVIGMVTIGGLVTFGAGVLLGRWTDAIAIVGWGAGLAVARLVSTAWLMWGSPWRYTLNLMASTGVRTVALIVLIVVRVDVGAALAVAGIASALASITLGPRTRGVGRVPRPWPKWFGAHLAIASLAFTILTNFSLVVLPLLVAKSDVGRFAAMNQVAALACGAILGALLTIAYPGVRRAWDDGRRAEASAALTRLMLICLLIGAISILVLDFDRGRLVALVVGPGFAVPSIIPALIVAVTCGSAGQVAGWFHQLHLRPALVGRRSWLAAIIGIAGTLLGTLLAGVAGASVGGAIGFFVYLAAQRWETGLVPWVLIVAAIMVAVAIGSALGPDIIGWPAVCVAMAIVAGFLTIALVRRSDAPAT